MIKLKATAVIHSISPVLDIPSRTGGQNFQKRELVLNDSWERDGETHPNFVLIEFSGDRMQQLDNFMPGQKVTVDAYVNGREHQGRFYNSIKGQSIVHYQPQQATVQQPQNAAPVPGGYPQQPAYPQAPQYPQAAPMPGGYPQQQAAPVYPQQQQYAAPAQARQQPYGQQPYSPGMAELPFQPR